MRRVIGYFGLAVGYLVLLVGGFVLVDAFNGLDWFGDLLGGLRRHFGDFLSSGFLSASIQGP